MAVSECQRCDGGIDGTTGWFSFSGNEIGILLAHWLWTQRYKVRNLAMRNVLHYNSDCTSGSYSFQIALIPHVICTFLVTGAIAALHGLSTLVAVMVQVTHGTKWVPGTTESHLDDLNVLG
jgi:hypothetical protein